MTARPRAKVRARATKKRYRKVRSTLLRRGVGIIAEWGVLLLHCAMADVGCIVVSHKPPYRVLCMWDGSA